MDAKDLSKEPKETIEELKAKGVTEIKIDNLIAYLKEVIESPGEELSPERLEKYKAELQVHVEQCKGKYAGNIEMFKAVISAGQEALRSSFLMNGGATVVLLAFIGKLSEHHKERIPEFSSSLLFFVYGVLMIAFAYGIRYLSQAYYADKNSSNSLKIANRMRFASVTLTIASYVFFILGVFKARSAFLNFA